MNQSTITLLLIEDSDTDVEIIKRVFSKGSFKNYALLHASNMAEARTLLQSEQNKIDIILLDLGLPDTKGRRDTYKQLQEANVQNLPTVILTSSDDQKLALEIVSWGAQNYICKSRVMQDSKSLPEVVDFSLCRHNHKLGLKQAMLAKMAQKEQILQMMGGGYSCSA